MTDRRARAVAVVGVGALLPDAPNARAFWKNLCERRYSITDVPPERWNVDEYYDPDPSAPDKTYSKIGGWVRGYTFDWQRHKVPPKVAAAMDPGQQWAVTIAAQALADYGYPERPLDLESTGVVLGAAMGGEMHYLTTLRVMFPEFRRALEGVEDFSQVEPDLRRHIVAHWQEAIRNTLPPVTEDSMPGELANIISGRVANLLNLRGPSFITDAACASSLAALDAAMDLLTEHGCDAVVTGGVDRNMGASTFVKFCKIGALSATGSRPFGEGADGFVMGEGSAAFLVKRLADAERAGDRIYAVIRGVGASSDGKGKGITAPNPIGQKLAVRRAWADAGLDPATAGMVEAHGTSTKVGDLVEVESLAECFADAGRGTIALGSVKSNFGHLKAGAGAAGLLKAVLAVHHKALPPTLNAERPNPGIDFGATPFRLGTDLREWPRANGTPRRAGVSAYGFGGTNFHVVVEEHVPGLLDMKRRDQVSVPSALAVGGPVARAASETRPPQPKPPLRGILALAAPTAADLRARVERELARAKEGSAPPRAFPSRADLDGRERLVIDFEGAGELADKLARALRAFETDAPAGWKALANQGVFRATSKASPGKIAFLFPGQGSQYVNMGRCLFDREPVFHATFDEADAVLRLILGRPLTSYLFADPTDAAAMTRAEEELRQTAVTQPAVLAVDCALASLLAEYGFRPDYVMGHSLGEYGALVAAGVLPFADALEAVAARGREMTRVSLADNGWMAAVSGPLDAIERVLAQVEGYVIPANINSRSRIVIGGETEAVKRALKALDAKGMATVRLPVSHAFHTRIVAPAAGALGEVLDRLRISSPRLPVVANVTGELYPTGPRQIRDLLCEQIAAPVQWVSGLETLWREGVRTFVEVGPKNALKGFADDVLGGREGLVSLFTNHPKGGEVAAFNQALCGLLAAGHVPASAPQSAATAITVSTQIQPPAAPAEGARETEMPVKSIEELVQVLTRSLAAATENPAARAGGAAPFDRNAPPSGSIVITGCGLGLPGAEKPVMDPSNVDRILRGEQLIDLLPARFREQMAAKNITRVVKTPDGEGRFESIDDTADVIKLAGRPGPFDLVAEYGVPAKLVEALDSTTQLAMAAGIDALREAGIPLVQTWRRTSQRTYLPDRWMLPESMRDETGVIFGSAFPGLNRFAEELRRYHTYEARKGRRAALEAVRAQTSDPAALREIDRQLGQVDEELRREPYVFDRRFILRVLPMGHSQFAEYIGARGPNALANAACASTAHSIAMAEDFIRTGRCRRVIVIAADNVTSDNLMEWIGAGMLATGAAATDDKVKEAAIPFDRRRHGTIIGMGAAALVVESQDAVDERGMRGIVELLSSETRNSAFHATRLDVEHVSEAVESLVHSAERRFGLDRRAMAAETVFMSHETFTPARGGSASAEVAALRRVFGNAAREIVLANTKGFTGHAMGVGVEDVVAVKILEHGIVPPVANFRDEDPELGTLNLSRGGRYPLNYAIHLAAGFGSQIALTLTRRIAGGADRIDRPDVHRRWLDAVSGQDRAETEVVKRTLRVVSTGAPSRAPRPAAWAWGTAPMRRAPVPGPVVTPGANPVIGVPSPPSLRVVPPPPVEAVKPAEPQPAAAKPAGPPLPPTPAPIATEPAPQPGPPSAPGPAALDPVAARVIAIVSQKTGYPPDLLDLDLDLEADLGVDTVKQAETFAAVREEWSIPRIENLKLRDFPTLRHVVGFVHQHRPDLDATSAVAPAAPAARPQAAEAPAAIPAPAAPVAASAVAEDPVTARVIAIVSEKTGYPPDLLDLDLDLEADLGVDTVKQAETFAAVREEWSIPRIENLKLRDFPTLRHVVGFVRQHRPDLAAPPAVAPAVADLVAARQPAVVPEPVASAAIPAAADPITARVVAIVSEKTGYPPDLLDLDLDLEADLGVDTVKQAETFAAVREEWSIPRIENLKLRDFPTLRHVVGFVRQHRPDLAAPPAVAPAKADLVAAPQPAALPEPVATATTPAADTITARVVAIVSEKTGYPPDLLDLDLDLEADLGVDTVKQAETFAAVREEWAIPRIENLKLRDFPTLRHVVGFVRQHRPDLAAPPAVDGLAAAPAPAATPALVAPEAHNLSNADQIPRRVASPVLRPPLAFCKPTGVELEAGSRVVVATGTAQQVLAPRLAGLGVTVLALDARRPVAELESALRGWLAEGPIRGAFWLPSLDPEPCLADLTLKDFQDRSRVIVKNLAATMRVLYESIAAPGTFLVAATRLGGLFGLGVDGTDTPLGGAVQGFVKAYKRERRDALVKVVDFAADATPQDIAEALLAEAQADPGVVEVGRRAGARWSIGLEISQEKLETRLPLGPEMVFVVTGAAGGITSAIVADLASSSRATFHLLDVVSPPTAGDPHIALFRAGRERLKEALIAEAKARGEKPTPVAIERQLMAIERQEAALRAIDSVVAAGGRAHWHVVNLLDDASIHRAVEAIRNTSQRIDVLLHAGGIEISRALPDKPDDEWARVFDIKASGFFSLLHATRDLPLGATVVFSSVAGRFGNSGQTDYSAANALLCAMSRAVHRAQPATRTIAIDWTAWGGIGMATRGSIPKVMEAAGIDMLAPEVGIPTVRRELVSGASDEIVVGGRLGILVEEWDPTGGLDPARAHAWLAERAHPFTMVGEVTGAPLYAGLTVETQLDPAQQPFLADHQIDGVPLLPGVMGAEAFAQVASVLCPDRIVTSLRDIHYHAPFKFHRMKPMTLHLTATGRLGPDDAVLVDVQLLSRLQPKPGGPAQERLHFRGCAVLEHRAHEPRKVAFRPPESATFDRSAIYRVYFHGPAYRVMDAAKLEEGRAIGVFRRDLPPNAADPAAAELVLPRLVELCYQTAGIIGIAEDGKLGLPSGLHTLQVLGMPPTAALYAEVWRRDDGGYDARVVDAEGNVWVELSDYRTVAFSEGQMLERLHQPEEKEPQAWSTGPSPEMVAGAETPPVRAPRH